MIAALIVLAALAWQPADADLVTLKRAALSGHFPIHYVWKNSSEMPRYDPIAFYPGPSDPRYVWESREEAISPEGTRYVNRALMLAAMDFGAAGEQWKRYYDDLVAQDAAQRPPVSDPYRYRHAFLDGVDARLLALAPAVPAPLADSSLDAQAAKISEQDLALVTNVYFNARGCRGGRSSFGGARKVRRTEKQSQLRRLHRRAQPSHRRISVLHRSDAAGQ